MNPIAAAGGVIGATLCLSVVGVAAVSTTTLAGFGVVAASAEAQGDIPPQLLAAFQREAANCTGLPWTVLAGVSKVESDHGRYGGATVGPTGEISPPIIGIPLDGTNGTARIPDTDDGRWDHDPVWDRAVGPFQFIPSSWRLFGGDGNGDSIADPHNILDALPAMRRHLCPEGQVSDVHAAVYSYNHSNEYVSEVLEWSRRYSDPPSGVVVGGYSLPVPAGLLDVEMLAAPHHDYPAWDAAVPVGTPVYAMTSGTVVAASTAGVYPHDPERCGTTVIIRGGDGAEYVYCHLSLASVAAGQTVTAGALIGASGGDPGAPGAGNTTGPHLHLSVSFDGRAVCPQPMLLAIAQGRALAVSATPSQGCVAGADLVPWSALVAITVPQKEGVSAS